MSGDQTAITLEASARDGIARGWSYTPLHGKDPFHKRWQHAPATTLEQVQGWISDGRTNLGVRTGAASGGLVVIDDDTEKHGITHDLAFPATVTVRTGSGGLHRYYLNTSGRGLANSAGKLSPHIDIRADGGQAVAAGSMHPDTGAVYDYEPGYAPWEIEVAELPDWVFERLEQADAKKRVGAKRPKAAADGASVVISDRYVQAALTAEIAIVRAAQNGTRNDTLNKSAFALGQLVGAGAVERAVVEQGLLVATTLPEPEARATIASGLNAGEKQPRALPASTTVPMVAIAPREAQPASAEGDCRTSDLSNAVRFRKQHGAVARYVHREGAWYLWEGTHWRRDDGAGIANLCKQTARSIYDEAKVALSPAEHKELATWAWRSQSQERLSAIERLARSECALDIHALDADPWAFNCLNYTIDLRDGSLRPHRPEDYITQLCPVAYNPSAPCPRWNGFVTEVLTDPAVALYVQRWLGHCLTGDISEQYLPILCGGGNNGKSVLLDTVSRVIGSGYATEAAPDLLVSYGSGTEHPTQIADLKGRRLVIASESEEHGRLRTQLVKRLTGNARLKGRFMHRDFFEFDRTHKMVLVTNNLPIITEDNESVWRRIRLIRFDVTVSKERQDKGLMAKLWNERQGILAWLVRGAVDWRRESLTEPAGVMVPTEAYRQKNDSFGAFHAEVLQAEEGAFTLFAALEQAYHEFCEDRGLTPLKGNAFPAALTSANYTRAKRGDQRGWVGVKFRS